VLDTLLHWLGYGLCHQLPARSFFAGAHQVPVCARDTGIYLGFVASLLVLAVLSRGRRPSELPRGVVLTIVGLSIAVLAWDGVTSYAGWRTTTNEIRLATGLLMGYALPAVLLPMLNGQLWRRQEGGRVPDGWREIVTWLVPVPVVFVLIRWPFEQLGIVYPLMVAVSIIATFVVVNLAAVSVLPFAEGRARTWRDLGPALGAAVALSVIEIAASAWLRVVLTRLATGR
jgi:uncharacterized membrane protein